MRVTREELKTIELETITQQVAKRLVELRNSVGWSRYRLADEVDLRYQTLMAWERGANLPSVPALCRIADVLGVTVDCILCREEIPADILERVDE